MIAWILEKEPSNNALGEYFWAESALISPEVAIYTKGEYKFVVRPMDQSLPCIAGPFDTFEAACAAYEMIKNG